ncbi:MAG: acyltransferase [Oligoflexia bacterium]|nr:acyltransferase [Oligoflexia bacterium]
MSSYVPALTGLRALAAALVFVHHMGQIQGSESYLTRVFFQGYIGVDIFFVLSGYLITRTYFAAFRNKDIGFGDYWFRRFARIFPAYLVVLMAKLALDPKPWPELTEWTVLLTLTQGFFGAYRFNGLSTAWSLTVEESFYLLAPLVYGWLGPVTRAGAAIGKLARTLLALSVGFWFVGMLVTQAGLPGYFLHVQGQMEMYSIFGRFTEFAIGILFALRAPATRPGLPQKAMRAELAFFGGLGLILLSMVVLLELELRQKAMWGILATGGIAASWIAALGAGFVISGCAQGSRAGARLLGNPLIEYLGRISYVFYLLQDDWITKRVDLACATLRGDGARSGVFTYLALTLLAAAVYELAEKPLHRLLLAQMSRTKRQRQASPALSTLNR